MLVARRHESNRHCSACAQFTASTCHKMWFVFQLAAHMQMRWQQGTGTACFPFLASLSAAPTFRTAANGRQVTSSTCSQNFQTVPTAAHTACGTTCAVAQLAAHTRNTCGHMSGCCCRPQASEARSSASWSVTGTHAACSITYANVQLAGRTHTIHRHRHL
jgi:hypothetical protein